VLQSDSGLAFFPLEDDGATSASGRSGARRTAQGDTAAFGCPGLCAQQANHPGETLVTGLGVGIPAATTPGESRSPGSGNAVTSAAARHNGRHRHL